MAIISAGMAMPTTRKQSFSGISNTNWDFAGTVPRPARSDDWDAGYNMAIDDVISNLNDFIDTDAPEIVQENCQARTLQVMFEKLKRVKPKALTTTPRVEPANTSDGMTMLGVAAKDVKKGDMVQLVSEAFSFKGTPDVFDEKVPPGTVKLVGAPEHKGDILDDTAMTQMQQVWDYMDANTEKHKREKVGRIAQSGAKYVRAIAGKGGRREYLMTTDRKGNFVEVNRNRQEAKSGTRKQSREGRKPEARS